jgi:nitroimidazol reductase NimA-like FMN-containing flavoprotein (pyridoxamine 5'-phosphate oxidase superfamily)
MVIREMTREECLRVLGGSRLARLGCAADNQPYVVPVYLALGDSPGGEPCLYGFTTPGQKVEWMRANPRVCVEVDEVAAHDHWVSVVVFGRYEELPEVPGADDALRRIRERPRRTDAGLSADAAAGEAPWTEDERHRAYEFLRTVFAWCEPGCAVWAARAHRDPAGPYVNVYYKVRIDSMTGHEATPNPWGAASAVPAGGRPNRLRRALGRVFGSGAE